MGKKRNRRSRRLETPSPERETNNTQIETPSAGNDTLTNSNVIVQESLEDGASKTQLMELSVISIEAKIWSQMFQQTNNDRIARMKKKWTTN